MSACSFGIWILLLHVNRSIRMKTDENSLYLGPFHRPQTASRNREPSRLPGPRQPPSPFGSVRPAAMRRLPPRCLAVGRCAGAAAQRGLGPAAGPLPGKARQRGGWAKPTRRPGAQPNGNPLPHAGAPPPPLRRLPGGRRKDGASTGGRRRLAARGPKGPRACQTKKAGAGGKASPLLFRALRAPPPPPGRLSFHRRQKGSEKPGPTLYEAGHTKRW